MSDKKDKLVGSFLDEFERAGSCAGIAEHLCMYPIDVVKTRIYTGWCSHRFFRVLPRMLRREGFRAFRGIHVALLGAIPSHAFMFSVYELVKKYVPPNNLGYGIAGVCGTMMHDLFATTFGVVKTRMMLKNPLSSREIVKSILKNEGLRAFFISYPVALAMNIPFVYTYFATYEISKKKLGAMGFKNERSVFLLSGAIAGGLAAWISNPFDIIKVCLMNENQGVQHIIHNIMRRHGILGFFRGATARAFYHIPSGMITWTVYELVKSFFEQRRLSEKTDL